MANKWDKKPWKENSKKWKDNSKKWKDDSKEVSNESLVDKDQEPENTSITGNGVLYLVIDSTNPKLLNENDLSQLIAGDILKLYHANGISWLKKSEIVYGIEFVDLNFKKLKLTDAMLVLTDDTTLSNFLTFAAGTTKNFFTSYTTIGESAPFTPEHLKELNYALAHELLHQFVARIGYFVYGNVSFYQLEDGHWDDGGLLTSGSNFQVEKLPLKRGTGIERISDDMMEDLKYWPKEILKDSPIMKYDTLTSPETLLARKKAMRDPALNLFTLNNLPTLQGTAYGIKGTPQYYDNFDNNGTAQRFTKPVYLYLKEATNND